MAIMAKFTVLALFLFSYFHSIRTTTIRRTTYEENEAPGDSSWSDWFNSQFNTGPPPADDNTDCPDCVRRKELQSRLSKEELDLQRIEIIKSQILKKLHMRAPPNITRPLDELPDPIALDEEYVVRDEREPEASSASEIYVFPESVSNCYTVLQRPMICFQFHFDTKIRHYSIHEAELYLYKLPDVADRMRGNQTFLLRQIPSPNEAAVKSGGNILRTTVTVREGWVTLDLKGAVYQWLRSRRHRRKGIEIICETCQNPAEGSPVGYRGAHKPFFKISMEKKTLSRHRRSVTCGETPTSCCVEQLNVDFRAIGWHWIRSPRRYNANYCRGSCREPIGAHEWHVSRVLTQVAAHSSDQQVQTDLAACCAPTSATPLDLIYYDHDGSNNLIKRTLHNMIINSCGCL